jgi:hypothetical protein
VQTVHRESVAHWRDGPLPIGSCGRYDPAFVAALEVNAVDITEANCAELSQLCDEFGSDGLTAQLPMYEPSAALMDAATRLRISALEERVEQPERRMADLQGRVMATLRRFEADIACVTPKWHFGRASSDAAEVEKF